MTPADPASNILEDQLVDVSAGATADIDPLVISQSLTYVTDDDGVVVTYKSAPFSLAFKLRFILVEAAFVLIVVFCIPIAAHGTVVSLTIFNCLLLAWFWYNHVRAVDIKTDGIRIFMGNFEFDILYDRIESVSHMIDHPCGICNMPHGLSAHRGLYSDPMDGVSIRTDLGCTPLWSWPSASDRPEHRHCCGLWKFSRLVLIFSPAGGSPNFIQDVENEMRNYADRHVTKPPGDPGNNPELKDDEDDMENDDPIVDQPAGGITGNSSGLSYRSQIKPQSQQQPFSGDLFDV